MEKAGDKANYKKKRAFAAADATMPMRVVMRLTGLTADTIRVWERRYEAVVPQRTQGQARRYSAADVHRLSLLRDVTAAGHSIGAVANLSDDALASMLQRASNASSHDDANFARSIIDTYLDAVAQFDVRHANEILTRAVVVSNPRELVLDVVAPLLREVGDRWQHGVVSVAQEHFVSAQCKSLLGSLLRSATTDVGAPRLLMAAPEGHQHDLGLLIGGVLAMTRGVIPVHLGPDVPWRELGAAVKRTRADALLMAFTRAPSKQELDVARVELARLCKIVDVWLGAPQAHVPSRLDARVKVFTSFEALDAEIANRFYRAG